MQSDVPSALIRSDPFSNYLASLSFFGLGGFFFWFFNFSNEVQDTPPFVDLTIGIAFFLISIGVALWFYINAKNSVAIFGDQIDVKKGLSNFQINLSDIVQITYVPKNVTAGGDLFSALIDAVAEAVSITGTVEFQTKDRKWNLFQIPVSTFLQFINKLEEITGKKLRKVETEMNKRKKRKIEFFLS